MQGRCPICRQKKFLVNYHIIYKPPVIIKACQDCNYLEYQLRKGYISYSHFNFKLRRIVWLKQTATHNPILFNLYYWFFGG